MDILVVIAGLVGSLIISAVVTGFLQKYALHRSLIDVPNERSSHLTPTPRGGGLSIVLAISLCIGLLFLTGQLQNDIAIALGVGGILVSVIGWIDDHKHIPALWRAIAYTIAAVLSVYCLGGFNHLRLGSYILSLGVVGNVLAVIWIVWMTNLYNFMDGTDALAAVQAMHQLP